MNADGATGEKRIVIAGYYGFGNTGDEAILAGMLHDLSEQLPEAGFTVVSGNPEETRNHHGVNALHWTEFQSLDEVISSADLVILGGGGILHDTHHFELDRKSLLTPSWSGLSYYASIPLLAALHGVHCMLYAVGAGPLESRSAQDLSAAVLDLCSAATVRDRASLEYLQEACGLSEGQAAAVDLAADPAFSFISDEETRPSNSHFSREDGRKTLGVNLRYWDFGQPQADWEKAVAAALDMLVTENDYRVQFIPFQVLEDTVFENDLQVCRRVHDLMEKNAAASILMPAGSFQDAIRAVEHCDILLGMRYHSVLFALQAGVPVSALNYDPKVRFILAEFGLGIYSLEQPWGAETIASAVKDSLQEQGRSYSVIAAVKERARRSAFTAVSLLEKGSKDVGPADSLIRELLLSRNRAYLQDREALAGLPALQQERDALRNLLDHREQELTQRTSELLQEKELAAELREEIQRQLAENQELSTSNQTLAKLLESLEGELQKAAVSEQKLKDSTAELMDDMADLRSDRDWQAVERERLAAELQEIHQSRYWRILSMYWRTRERLSRFWQRVLRGFHFSSPGETLKNARGQLRRRQALQAAREKDQQHNKIPPMEVRRQPDVVVLPIIDWDFRFQRPQQMARQFADHGQRVFYARTEFSPDGLESHRVEPNVYQVELPGPKNLNLYRDVMSEEAAVRILEGLEQLAFEKGITDAVCMIQLPFWTPLAIKLRERFGWLLVYDCMDDHAGFSTNHSAMTAQEDRLLRECDLALATSKVLQETAESKAKRTLLLPNAVDFERFSVASNGDRPDDLPVSDGPVIGYVGAISDWFDFDLLKPAVEAHPEWTFVCIGSTWGADRHEQLERRPNVHFLGEKPYEEIPGYLGAFDCCVIPFKDTRLTRATNPVKLYEYLAAGKPVVAKRLPELEAFGDSIYLADDDTQFLEKLELALEGESDEKAAERVELVRRETWEARFTALRAELDELFGSVTVVIVTWNNLDLTRLCLESLLRSTSHPDLEVIIVDNASEDGTPAALQEYAASDDRIRLILNDTNRGFGPALNQGIEVSRGDYLAVLNNDVILTPGWLAVMTSRLRKDPSIGMIGPVSNGAWNEALVHGEYSCDSGMMTFARERASRYAGSLAPIKMLAMYCVILPRRVLDSIGMLDEEFGIGMFEDDDYALRIRKAGWRIAAALDVYIHHQSRSGFKKMSEKEYDKLFRKNRKLFERKWKTRWEPHVSRPLEPDIRIYAELEHLLAGRESDKVFLFPGLTETSLDFAHSFRLAEKLRDRGAAVFFVDPSGLSGKIVQDSDGIFLADIPLIIFDVIQSPVVFVKPGEWGKILHLRSPRIVYDLRSVKEDNWDRSCCGEQHQEILGNASVILVRSDFQQKNLEEAGIQVPLVVEEASAGKAFVDDLLWNL